MKKTDNPADPFKKALSEATRALADLVIDASGGVLADDAALLVLDWHGDHGEPRSTVDGADQGPRG